MTKVKTLLISEETGELINTIKQGDKIRIIREESLQHLKKDNNTIELNTNANFIKLYTDTLEDLINENLTSADFKIILVCLKNLRYETGAVAFENTGYFLSQQDIVKSSGLTKMTVYTSIERLVDKKILHKGVTGKEYQLFMNPFIFMKGIKVNKTLCAMFAKSKWNKCKIKNKRDEKAKN